MSVSKEGVRMIAAKGTTCGDLSTCCLLAQATLVRKLMNQYFVTKRTMETMVCVLDNLFASLSFMTVQQCCLSSSSKSQL